MMILLAALVGSALGAPAIRLYPGFVSKVSCEGRVLISAVGDNRAVHLEPLPNELGCSFYVSSGKPGLRSNLRIETSSGSIHRQIVVMPLGTKPNDADLEHLIKGDAP